MHLWFVLLLLLNPICFSDNKDYWIYFKTHKSFLKHSSQDLTSVLRNRHLVMVGDSLTRYQYISLVYTLTHGEVLSSKMAPNIVQEKDFKSWNDFFHLTNDLFKPMEVCDCYRDNNASRAHSWFENRYYRDDVNNISVSFIAFVGRPSFSQGYLLPNETTNKRLAGKFPLTNATRWNFLGASKVFANYVVHLAIQPSVLLFNTGLWGEALTEEEVAEIVFNAYQLVDFFIWKSTTFTRGQTSRDRGKFNRVDSYFKAFDDNVVIMNTSWTRQVETEYRWDEMHFREPVYSVLNMQLLDILRVGFKKP